MRRITEAGGLMSYGSAPNIAGGPYRWRAAERCDHCHAATNLKDAYRQMGAYTGRVLKR